MKLKTKIGLLGATFLTAAAFGATPAAAQDAPLCPDGSTPAEGEVCEEEAIVVTGSRLRRSPENAPAPLIQVTQETLLQSGEPNLVDFLADVPALSGSTVPEDTTGAGLNDGGLSLLNLRDLGAVRTLVLVDGRRHVGAPQGGLQVDVDSIPTLLVDNVEIITGGQSAVYGADAVSGVVNFIMRRDFEGIDVDGSLAQINQDGQLSGRVSGLIGHNFYDDRMNVYAFAEYQRFNEVRDQDMDWRRKAWTLFNNDSDTAGVVDDGQFDNILMSDMRDAFFQRGGVVVLANQVLDSIDPNDPDINANNCLNTASFNAAIHNISGNVNCFNIAPENNSTFVFDSNGVARPFNFGTFQDENGASRRLNVGGDGLNTGTEFGTGSRIPQSEAMRYQMGLNFDIFENTQFFLEGKFVHEETFDEAQPTFFQGGIGQATPGVQNRIFSLTNFNISDDNAFLDPALRAMILANTRNTSDVNPAQVADRRATWNLFGPIRTQFNTREVTRLVGGFRGDMDQLWFVNNFNWEIGYTYGRTINENRERGVDVIRFHYVDAGGVLGTPGAIVCRSRLLQAQGFTVLDPLTGTVTAANNAALAACVPQSIFGVDLRNDGYNPAAENYYNATIEVSHTNHQHDLLAFGAGELWDFWGAGPIGLSIGYEYRREKTGGIGRSTGTAGRLLFLNTGPDFEGAGYETDEYFAEVNVPLISDHPWLGEMAEFSMAYRYSDYTTVGPQEARSAQMQWRPIGDLLLRATYGESVRVPNLAENFAPPTQTFANGLIDPCDANAMNNPLNAQFLANRVANCQALATAAGLPANFIWPGFGPTAGFFTVGIAGTGVYASGRSGVNSGNPFLAPEQGRSYTASIAYQPSWWDDFSVVFDYYDIEITDAIATVTAQQAINQCVNGPSLNTLACATIFRLPAGDPNEFQLPQTGVGFIQGSLNYAKTEAQGIDFSANYHLDIAEMFSRNWGEIDFSLRGNYLIGQDDFTSIADPTFRTSNDTFVGLPRVRFLLTTTWEPVENLRLIWDWDWQASQEIIGEQVLVNNPDDRDPKFRTTGDFSQHDFALSYDLNDNLQFRAGVVNAFDEEPAKWLGSTTSADNFDLFGRRYFMGVRFRN
jgi:outer membrane receptor protein involved in Fe transport